jgi:mannitol-1-phosphate 5-dehydrogenase
MKSAVHFGAGNIGRGFIGLLLHQAGYRVTFVDVNASVVADLNARGSYTVRLAATDPQPVTVTQVDALNGTDGDAIATVIAGADLVTTAVGPAVLRLIAPTLARGLQKRLPHQAALTVIACENLIGASELLGRFVRDTAPAGAAMSAMSAVFANCAVDRIVPLQTPDPADPLAVTVEPFCEWVIDATGFTKTSAPKLPGALFVTDLRPYIERKLFTVNTGHAALAYLGYQAGCRFIHEAVARPELRAITCGALRESGVGLVARHRFDPQAHAAYIEKTLGRFSNPLLPDEVVRVGRSPLRKLGRDDRLVAPACLALEAGVSPDNLAQVIAAVLAFNPAGDPETAMLQAELRVDGPAATLTRRTGLSADHPLHRLVLTHCSALLSDV